MNVIQKNTDRSNLRSVNKKSNLILGLLLLFAVHHLFKKRIFSFSLKIPEHYSSHSINQNTKTPVEGSEILNVNILSILAIHQTIIMKRLFNSSLWLMVMAFVIMSCSKDEEVQPDLDNVEFTFDAENPPVTIPPGLQSSNDNRALLANAFLSQANGIISLVSAIQPPPGATRSDTPISGSNGNVTVYIWSASDGGRSVSYAYQVSETSTHYVFELFMKLNNDHYTRYWHSQQSKSGKQGFLELFGDDEEGFSLRYEWVEIAGVFHFDLISSDTKINIISNPDNSGSLKFYEGGKLETELTWNADGTAGTYAEYDAHGNLEESGVWPE